MLTLWLGGADDVRKRVEQAGGLALHRCRTAALAAKVAHAGLVGAVVLVVPDYRRGCHGARALTRLRVAAPSVPPLLLAARFDYDEGVMGCEDGALAVLELASAPGKLARMIRAAIDLRQGEAKLSGASAQVDDRAFEAVARLA